MLSLYKTTAVFESSLNKKCAEVFCQTIDNFSIICTFCEMKSFLFEDFLMHFKNVHLDNIERPGNPLGIKVENVPTAYHEGCERYEEYMKDNDINSCAEFPEFRDSYIEQSFSDSDYSSKKTAGKQDASADEYIPKVLNSLSKNPSDIKYKCNECNKSYKRKKTLEYHVSTYHNKNNQFKCSRCKQNFDTESSLDSHMKTKHVGFQCDQCQKVYKTRTILKLHKLTHTEERNFVCDVANCHKAFYTLKVLNRHVKISHIMENNIICELCGYRTKTKHHLAVHYRSHTGEKPFACKNCDRRFASSSLLTEHRAMHLTTKPHVCDVCGASFSRPKTLYHHKHLHLGIKKFVCKICGKAYAQAAGLCGHMRQHKEEQF